MNPHDPTRKTDVIHDWADTLVREARKALGRMDTTLTLAEAKIALVRRVLARRREDDGA